MTFGYPKPEPKPRKGKTRFIRRKAPKAKKRRPKAPRRSPYLHPAWLKLRDKVMKRAKGVCENCRACEARHVHHERYGKGRGWRRLIVPMRWLLAVCVDCHNGFHPLNAKGWMLESKFQEIGFYDDAKHQRTGPRNGDAAPDGARPRHR